MRQLFVLFIVASIAFCTASPAISAMSSTNYYIYADSVETGGGLSTGGAYSLENTVGESPAGFSSSSVYEIRAGYQHMERGYISLYIDDNSLGLGSLSTSTVNMASTSVTVSTDSVTGYTMAIGAVVGTMIASVSDGAVTSGSEEYGFSAAGSESVVSGDVAVAAATPVAAASFPIDGSQTVMTFKASRSVGTTAGVYSQTVTLTASANI